MEYEKLDDLIEAVCFEEKISKQEAEPEQQRKSKENASKTSKKSHAAQMHEIYLRQSRAEPVMPPTETEESQPTFSGFFPPAPRVPLAVHKEKLIDLLTDGPASRGQITAKLGIPPGSLSELLKGEEFVQVRRGFWGLASGKKDVDD